MIILKITASNVGERPIFLRPSNLMKPLFCINSLPESIQPYSDDFVAFENAIFVVFWQPTLAFKKGDKYFDICTCKAWRPLLASTTAAYGRNLLKVSLETLLQSSDAIRAQNSVTEAQEEVEDMM